jgi:hypothetical protein
MHRRSMVETLCWTLDLLNARAYYAIDMQYNRSLAAILEAPRHGVGDSSKAIRMKGGDHVMVGDFV